MPLAPLVDRNIAKVRSMRCTHSLLVQALAAVTEGQNRRGLQGILLNVRQMASWNSILTISLAGPGLFW